MQIPNKVRIGSMDYIVELTDKTLYIENTICYGTIDYEKHLIEINSEYKDEQGQEQIFLHELVHGIVKERNLDLKNSDEETITDEIAMGLHQVIKDNLAIFINSKVVAEEHIMLGDDIIATIKG
ncbi:hypothetical protein [Clostridium sp.]|uniref:hypothetical protein n=1 Tax=Clostridium sp. TaxID=1506 RepID=UPI00321627BA